MAKIQQNNQLKAQSLSYSGFAHLELGNHTKAMTYYLEALNIARQEKNKRAEIDALKGIGLVYGESGNNEEAIIHLEQVLALERESGGPGEYAALINCAFEYVNRGDYARALRYGQESLALTQAHNDPLAAIFARNRIGEAYMGMGQFIQANTYFLQNLDFLQEPNLKPRRLHTLWNLGKLRIQQQEYKAAIGYLEEALPIAFAADGKQFIYEIHETLAQAHKSLGNFELALYHYEQFHQFKGMVFDEKSKNARRGLEFIYRTESARRETALLQQKNEELEREIQERKRAEETALHASQAKSQFLATMSHELRTPLNSIIGFAELAEFELVAQQNLTLVEDVRRIHKNGLHLLELVNDVLDMARIESGKLLLYPEKISAWLIVQEVVDFLPRFAKSGVEVIVSADPELPEIVVDATRIKQILLNLLSNAFKFTEGGWVKLSAEATAVSIDFTIEDSGIGIPPDKIPVLFETFAQIDIPQNRTLRGTGLGLPIARDLAKLHGGTINVVSELGKGSKFTVTLPLNQSMALSPDNE
jgi:signal transduction histidine kinase